MLQIYLPDSFNWFILLAGEISIFSGIILLFFHNRERTSNHA
jgi:hypothetical protein